MIDLLVMSLTFLSILGDCLHHLFFRNKTLLLSLLNMQANYFCSQFTKGDFRQPFFYFTSSMLMMLCCFAKVHPPTSRYSQTFLKVMLKFKANALIFKNLQSLLDHFSFEIDSDS